MTVLIWIVLAFVLIKCIGWVLAPFRRTEPDEYIEEHHNHYNVNVQITDSFNTDHSVFKGGAYYGIEETDEETYEETDYFTKTFGGKYRRR